MVIGGTQSPRLAFGLLLLIAAGACLAAEAYKWVDERGVTNYGEKPPANRPATPVDTRSGVIVETGGQFSKPAEPERPRGAEASQQPRTTVAPVPAPTAIAARGMDFDVYIRLQRGMTEGELLLRAGRPDYESLDGFRYDIVKTYYYFPTSANPYTTVVTLRGGRIFEIERVKKF